MLPIWLVPSVGNHHSFTDFELLVKQSPTHWGRDKMADIFQTIFSNAFSWMKMYEFWLRFHRYFIPRGPINNIPAVVQIMACRRPGDKPLYEPVMVKLMTHICVIRPQWVKYRPCITVPADPCYPTVPGNREAKCWEKKWIYYFQIFCGFPWLHIIFVDEVIVFEMAGLMSWSLIF